MTAKFQELVAKLKEIFQLDKPELDFGIYRIMHMRAKEIGEFLEKRLAEKVRAALAGNSAAEKSALEKELEEAVKNAKALGADPEVLPKVQELKAKIAALGGDDDAEAAVYSHLLTFFSRYYDDGDFISKRRYKEGVYAIPYEGEEVKLHWANADQYYVKSGESFQNYSFKLEDGKRVNFKLVTAETAKDNIKDNDAVRCFVLWDPANAANLEDEEKAAALPKSILEEVDGELYIYFQYLKFKKGSKQKDFTEKAEEKIGKELGARQLLVKFNLFALAPTEKDKKRTVLTKHLQQYVAKNTSDYFIHKDLKGFLTRELDFYIKNEMMHLDDVVSADSFKPIEQSLRKISAVRTIASELITFMAQLEDFQKKLWLKKKFVTQCDYCITMDRVPESLHAEVFANEKQQAEWKKLGFPTGKLVDAKSSSRQKQGDLFKSNDKTAAPIDARMVDTKFFDETFKAKLLRLMPDLDEKCDGVLIHSDNFQALNFAKGRYRSQVDCVYIDPPYNTDASEIIYKNGYKDSSWLSLMCDRLWLDKTLMKPSAIHCTAIDDAEFSRLNLLLADIYGSMSQNVALRVKPSGRPIPNGFAISHDYALFNKLYSSTCIARLEHSDDQVGRYREKDDKGRFFWEMLRKAGSNSLQQDRPTMCYCIVLNEKTGKLRVPEQRYNPQTERYSIEETLVDDEIVIWPAKDDGSMGRWYLGKEKVEQLASELKAEKQESGLYYVYYRRRQNEGAQPTTVWFDARYSATEHGTDLIKKLFGDTSVFSYPKSFYAVYDCLKVSNSIDHTTSLDYFGGSGTTAHAVINLNREDGGKRKYILVEMGDHFDTVLKPRIEKVVYSADWKDGKPVFPNQQNTGISHCFKYLTLESYEDALNNIELEDKGAGLLGAMKDEYLIEYMMDLEAKGSLIKSDDFRHPFDYQLKIAVDSSGASEKRKIDLVETFNYLIGLRVDSYVREIDKGYVYVDGHSPKGEHVLVVWRDVDKVDNAALNKLLDKLGVNPSNTEFDVVYVNGDHAVANVTLDGQDDAKKLKVRQTENEFLDRMFEDVK